MRKRYKFLCLLLAAALLLSGCGMLTVEEMYRLPKRSKDFNNLQTAIDGAMAGMEYCAPQAGENQQTVQMADLDGDGEAEYLLFAKTNQERPLRVLVFRNIEGTYVNTDTISCNGSAFDQVEYADMDGDGGLEIIVGRKLNDQVIRSVSVYTLTDESFVQLITVNCTKFMSVDLDANGVLELFVLRPGQTEADCGVAELYSMVNGTMERYNEVPMSQPVQMLKRIILGRLVGGKSAVYVASAAGDAALMTDVYALSEEKLVNVALSNESGTNVKTVRNFYIYADDIDNDTVVELPSLITMRHMEGMLSADMQHLIRWYSMSVDGAQIDKMYTYHNFVGGWYMQLQEDLASRISVVNLGYYYEFYVWDTEGESANKVMTIYAFTGENREEQGLAEGRFVLQKTDSVTYAAMLEENASDYGLTNETVVYSFRLIQQDWKTGET